MKTLLKIPFYSNTPDDTHCFQAGLKMVLKYFLPEKNFSFEVLDKISAKKEGLWTWPIATVLWMQKNGFEVIDMEPFDFQRFIQEGGEYLIDEFGREMGEAQIKNSDVEQERKLSVKLLKVATIQKVVPTIADIKRLMEEGYIIMVNINSRVLNKREGYTGHFVVLTGFDEKGFILHDPGLPGVENLEVPLNLFERAWAYPNEKAKNIMAFKLKG